MLEWPPTVSDVVCEISGCMYFQTRIVSLTKKRTDITHTLRTKSRWTEITYYQISLCMLTLIRLFFKTGRLGLPFSRLQCTRTAGKSSNDWIPDKITDVLTYFRSILVFNKRITSRASSTQVHFLCLISPHALN